MSLELLCKKLHEFNGREDIQSGVFVDEREVPEVIRLAENHLTAREGEDELLMANVDYLKFHGYRVLAGENVEAGDPDYYYIATAKGLVPFKKLKGVPSGESQRCTAAPSNEEG